MKVLLKDKKKKTRTAFIRQASKADLDNTTHWQFNWKTLSKSNSTRIYKLETEDIEGFMMIEFIEPEFFEMKNIEVSPSNYGSKGKYTNVAQLLISYGCLLSFEYNKGPYQGYLSFISKGNLIDYYIEKYNAELVYRERMYINPIEGLKLIKKHLKIEL